MTASEIELIHKNTQGLAAKWLSLRGIKSVIMGPGKKKRTFRKVGRQVGTFSMQCYALLRSYFRWPARLCQVGMIPHIFVWRTPTRRPRRLSVWAFLYWRLSLSGGALGRTCTFVLASRLLSSISHETKFAISQTQAQHPRKSGVYPCVFLYGSNSLPRDLWQSLFTLIY
jgi:hypothetical protein